MKKKIKWGILLVVILGITYGLYRFSTPPATDQTAMFEQDLISFPVTQEALLNTIEVKGKSSYERETIVYAPFTGKVKQWKASDAQQVKKGDLLFHLDPADLQKEAAQLETAIKKSKLEQQLSDFQASVQAEQGSSATTEEEAKQQYADREAAKIQQELNEVNLQMQQQELTALYNKVNTANYYAATAGIFLYDDPDNLPQYVQENARIGKIVDTNKLQLVTLVGEQDVFSIAPGMPVSVKINALKDVTLSGQVVKVSKFAKTINDTNSSQPAQFEVIISLEAHEQLIAGLTLTGQVEIDRKDAAVVVPTVAVMKDDQGAYVMLKTASGTIERRNIETGMETAEKTEVVNGVQPGDTVVLQ